MNASGSGLALTHCQFWNLYGVSYFTVGAFQQAKLVQTDMTYLQLKSLEVKSANDLSKKDSVISDLQTVCQVLGTCHMCV